MLEEVWGESGRYYHDMALEGLSNNSSTMSYVCIHLR